jgi:serine protease Do
MKSSKFLLFFVVVVFSVTSLTAEGHTKLNSLQQFDAELTQLTAKVSPAVVQIVVSGYAPAAARDPGVTPILARQQSIGSGVILDASGYIITNAHVVKGAERIQVVITKTTSDSRSALPASPEQSVLPAKVLGITEYFDLALLKVEASGLPVLPFADFRAVTQGQLVVAVGSPEGLENSATMGIISSVARQADPASPVVYVQTDAPINPGNSGGALVDVKGNLLGINTFILTQGGGSEGLGFALPAPVVNMVYHSLREKGHVDRRTIGLGIQQITPTMAQALGLARVSGLIVCDVMPDGPAEAAGVKIGDVIIEADDRSLTTPPQLDGTIYSSDLEEPLDIIVLRGHSRTRLRVNIMEEQQHSDFADEAGVQSGIVKQLGIMAATVTPEFVKKAVDLRIPSGVFVIARTADPTEADLQSGDIIHAVNNAPVNDLETLRSKFADFKHGDAVVLQIERQGGLQFATFEVD